MKNLRSPGPRRFFTSIVGFNPVVKVNEKVNNGIVESPQGIKTR